MEHVYYHDHPHLHQPSMVLGFSGWMDSGKVSTTCIDHLAATVGAERLASVDPFEFYILNLPVSAVPTTIVLDGERTEVRAVNPADLAGALRPHTEIHNGIIRGFGGHRCELLYSEDANMILFRGEEPHVRWRTFGECILDVAERYDVRDMWFAGSVSSAVPHTRPPRIRASMSNEGARERVRHPHVGYTDYEGPASFPTLLVEMAAQHGIAMRALVVEVPHYPFLEVPVYYPSILRLLTVLGDLLPLEVPLSDMRQSARLITRRLDDLRERSREFRDLVAKLEESYDFEEGSGDERLLRRLIDQIDLSGEGGDN